MFNTESLPFLHLMGQGPIMLVCFHAPAVHAKMWNASRFCVSSLRRGHANLLCIVPNLVYVPPKLVQDSIPDRPARSQSLYRQSYRTHILYIYVYIFIFIRLFIQQLCLQCALHNDFKSSYKFKLHCNRFR